MVKYCIDYRNGGLGNTILAHVLYASNQVDINLRDFFSDNGHAHKIQKINSTELTADHLVEFPKQNLVCLLQLVSTDWYELLRHKMSYSKWMVAEPNLENYRNFFQNHDTIDYDKLWLEFYNNLKDPGWPDCDEFNSVSQFPLYIQEEINEQWNPPSFDLDSECQLVEFLVLSYYDNLVKPFKPKFDCETYDIGTYLEGKFDQLIELSQKLDWTWNDDNSEKFYHSMIQNNKTYLTWLDLFKKKYYNVLNTGNLDWELTTWEFSYMLSKIFFDLGKNPRSIKWQNLNFFFNDKSLKLNQLME